MSVFSIEFFSEIFEYVGHTVIENCDWKYDYMAIEPTIIRTEPVSCRRGNYIKIFNEMEKQTNWGYITQIELQDGMQEITIMPIVGKLNVECYKDRNDLKKMSAEMFLKELIAQAYQNPDDIKQNIKGLEIVIESRTENAVLNLVDDIHNIYDIAIRELKKYRIFVEFMVLISEKKIICTIRKATDSIKTIEADLNNVIQKTINFKDTYEIVNKIVIYGEYQENKENFGKTEKAAYYLTPAGEITKTPGSQRILPVIWNIEKISIQENFEQEAQEKAYERLYREEADNNIELVIQKKDRLVTVRDLEIGQKVTVISNGAPYNSIFTGFEEEGEKIIYIFGAIRTEYSKNIGNWRK